MKKLSIFLASVLALISFSSCEDDKEPVLQIPGSDSFEVYAPALQDQYYELTSDGTFEIVCKSQPNYGAPVGPTIYGLQVALSDQFTDAVTDENGEVVTAASYKELTAINSASTMIFNDEDLAQAICQLKGLTKDDVGYVFSTTEKVYMRATCRIDGVSGSTVVSKNIVTLNKVMPYFAIPSPGFIYLVGAPEGWAGPSAANEAHYNDWKMFEKDDAIGSAVYYGTFQVDAGSAMFRFYTALTGWDNDSYGSQEDDNPIEYEFTDGVFAGKVVKGKGSFSFPSWPGGAMTICVDMSDMNNITVKMTAE